MKKDMARCVVEIVSDGLREISDITVYPQPDDSPNFQIGFAVGCAVSERSGRPMLTLAQAIDRTTSASHASPSEEAHKAEVRMVRAAEDLIAAYADFDRKKQ